MVDAGVPVRLCKGAYAEGSGVAFEDNAEVNRRYRELLAILLQEGTFTGITTHNTLLVDHARRLLRELGTTPDRYEFQMLLGVRPTMQRRLAAIGYPVRVYVPYGEEWYPYLMRRLAERPANLMFVLRSLVAGQ
jgi:proline dehydrogenase